MATEQVHIDQIEVIGARVHNLKNVTVHIPRGKLTVITGLSGSGKSSLAFDTLYAEGQRRYIDTFSSYARGFLGNITRPDVDKITGLSPVISIDQKTTNKNPRSTVGTATEVYDYLRLLFARAADAYSYKTGEKMVHYTDEQIIDLILKDFAGKKVLLMAPLVKGRKGHYKELFERYRKRGFVYVRIDGELHELTQGMKVDRYKIHYIELVVDRLKVTAPHPPKGGAHPSETEDRKRLLDSVGKAMQQGNGMMMVAPVGGAMSYESLAMSQDNIQEPQVRYFSRNLMCPTTGLSYADPIPANFSFNSPQGACPHCKGLGVVNGIDEVVVPFLDMWKMDTAPTISEEDTEEWKPVMTCPHCGGSRLCQESLSYKFGTKNLGDLVQMDVMELQKYLQSCAEDPSLLTDKQRAISHEILKEINKRLQFMIDVGLGYLSLGRSADSLSGGEHQRIRLATQIGSQLVNVLYILDEPSIGLHQRDNERLIKSLRELRDMGNTIIVVEHDEQMMREADWIIDIGPKAGRLGGKIVFEGTPADLLKTDTLTAQYLNGSSKVGRLEGWRVGRLEGEEWLHLKGCTGNNLKHVNVDFPLGKMIGVTGVSGSGKSTLINQTLFPILQQHLYRSLQDPMPYESIEGLEHIDKVVAVDQSPIGRTARSNPATYTGVWNDIRALFVQLPESQIRGWKQGRFSFNTKGGRCEVCAGNGYKTIQMHFMPDVYVPCEACGGKRYNKETLEVRFKGKTIADVLDMTINQAVEFFESQPYILNKIRVLQEVGLGYVKLGQSSTTLSGGESQRMKLAAELSRRGTGKTVYILDEPTTGLHFEDIRVLLGVLRQLVDKGNSVIIIEHNLDVIRACDYLIDMGVEGGKHGGEIVAVGTQEDLKNNPRSITGRFL